MDGDLLKRTIAYHGDTQIDLSKKLNISSLAVNLKINGKYQFTLREVSEICRIYKLTATEMIEIFFDELLDEMEL